MLKSLSIDRTSGVPLTDQLEEQLKTAIVRGDFRAGSVLPGIKELAAAAGASEKVARVALRRLSDDGWTRTRRHVGSVVVQRGMDNFRWRVLFFSHNPYFCYHTDRLVAEMRTRLLREKCSVSTISLSRHRGVNNYLQLEEMLKERWDLIIENNTDAKSRKMIEDSGWPFVVFGSGTQTVPSGAANCVGVVRQQDSMAIPDFVKACARKNVRSVVQMVCDLGTYDVTEMLRIVGVNVRTERTPIGVDPESVAHGAYDIVDGWLRKGGDRLPDVILFTDDYLAQGGLLALLKHGVRIPGDVGVVSFVSKGHLPIWNQKLTRLESDPIAHGVMLAKAVRTFLRGKSFPSGVTLGTVWKLGDTF